jgi:hypothetical protein
MKAVIFFTLAIGIALGSAGTLWLRAPEIVERQAVSQPNGGHSLWERDRLKKFQKVPK